MGALSHNMLKATTLLFFFLPLVLLSSLHQEIIFDDSVGFGRTFEGIGGLSGGGATSKLLVNYPKDKRDQILDFLFKPNFGASLQIFKVEIGGDVQSTDGTEASHMHNSWDENYQRGYEWWLMKEAKLRNPHIKLYGLPWGFPGWIGQGTRSPYTNVNITADYVVRWINGAKKYHNLTIDYVGIWNERHYDITYIKALRALLNKRGFQNTQIIAADGHWDIADDMIKDADLAKDIYAIGVHYPGTTSTDSAVKTGKALWSSEDYSTYNDLQGGGCWARILNQNYVNGQMTSTISWNLIASYYPTLPFYRDGLMTAVEPWSGNYSVDSPIWLTAHTTQFSSIGWKYLSHKAGVGKLPKGGSYVSLASPVGGQLTIVFETMTHDHSKCIRPALPAYSVEAQIITVTLKGSYAPIEEMNVWYSKLDFTGAPSTLLEKKQPLKFRNGMANLQLGLDELITLTTLKTGQKGSFPSPSPSAPFPLPYKDNFEGYRVNEEPFNLAQQSGSFEIVPYRHNKILRQMVLDPPVRWCRAIPKPFNLIGDPHWKDIFVEIDFHLPPVNATSGVYIAARVDEGGCKSWAAHGIFLFIQRSKYFITNDLARTIQLHSGYFPQQLSDNWHRISLYVKSDKAVGAIDGKGLFNITIPKTPTSGFVAIGTDDFGLADFDNLLISSHSDGLQKMTSYFHHTDLQFVSEKH